MVVSWSEFRHTDHFHGNGHKLCNFFVFESCKTTKIKRVNTLILRKKLPKRLIYYIAYSKYEEEEYSRSEFYCREDLEMSNVETETGIGEKSGGNRYRRFFLKKSANTNKKIATDLNTHLH